MKCGAAAQQLSRWDYVLIGLHKFLVNTAVTITINTNFDNSWSQFARWYYETSKGSLLMSISVVGDYQKYVLGSFGGGD